MKARIRKTGEIVDVICFNGSHVRSHIDFVSYRDSNGDEHDRESLNYYWDFEPMDTFKDTSIDIHWQEVRERAVIAAMQGLLANPSRGGCFRDYAESAINYADALIEQLKSNQ